MITGQGQFNCEDMGGDDGINSYWNFPLDPRYNVKHRHITDKAIFVKVDIFGVTTLSSSLLL